MDDQNQSASGPAAEANALLGGADPALPPKAEPKPQDDDFSRKFAALSRRERAILEQEQRFKGERQSLTEYQKAKEAAKQNPVAYLKQLGLSVDDIVQHVLNEGQPATVEDEVKSIRAEIEAYKKKEAEALESRKREEEELKNKQVIDGFKKKIVEFINQDTDRFEAIHTNEAYEDVFEVINNYFEKTGEVLSIEKAADSVEAHLVDDFKQTQERFSKLKKLAPKEPTETDLLSPQDTKPAPTLTNNITASSVASNSVKPRSREDSLKEAARLLRWSQKS